MVITFHFLATLNFIYGPLLANSLLNKIHFYVFSICGYSTSVLVLVHGAFRTVYIEIHIQVIPLHRTQINGVFLYFKAMDLRAPYDVENLYPFKYLVSAFLQQRSSQ